MLIILDRDGVINYESAEYVKSPEEWIPIPGSLEAIALLSQQGYQVIIATNQSGIARGLFSESVLNAIHEKMTRELKKLNGEIKEIFYCPHHPTEGCFCRKPNPGLLLKIAEKYKADLKKSWFVGDSLSDIQAAQAVNCLPVLVKTGKGLKTFDRLKKLGLLEGILVFDSLQNVDFQHTSKVS